MNDPHGTQPGLLGEGRFRRGEEAGDSEDRSCPGLPWARKPLRALAGLSEESQGDMKFK